MVFNIFRDMKPMSQLVMTAFTVVIFCCVVLAIALLAAVPFVGIEEMMNLMMSGDLSHPITLKLFKYIQVMQSIGLFVVPSLFLGWLFEGSIVRYFNLGGRVDMSLVFITVGIIIVIAPFISFTGFLNKQMTLPGSMAGIEEWIRLREDAAEMILRRFLEVDTFGGLLFNIFMIAVIPAVGEELLFRGVIQKIFTSMTRNYHWGIWISALLFSALHMQFYGFVPRMLLGALFGYMLVYGRSLWLPIISHFVNNLIGVLFLFAEYKGFEQVEKVSEFGETYRMWPVALVSLTATLSMIYMLQKRQNRNFEQ